MSEYARLSALEDLIRWSPFGLLTDDPGYTLPFADFVQGDLPVEYSLAKLAPLLEEWPETPAYIREALGSGIPAEALASVPPGLQSTRGWITQLPLYCALWAQPMPEHEAAGRVAQATVLLAGAILTDEGQGIGMGGFAAATYSACRAARRIGQNEYVPTCFAKALGSANSLAGVLDAVASTRGSGVVLTDRQQALVSGIDVLVRDAVDFRLPRTRSRSSGNSRPRVIELGAEVGDLVVHHQVSQESGTGNLQPRVTGPIEQVDDLAVQRSIHQERQGDPARQRAPKPPRKEVDDLVVQHSIHQGPMEGLPDPEDLAEATAASAESPQRSVATISVPLSVPAAYVGPRQMLWRATFAARAIKTSAQSLLLAGDRLQLVDLEAAERYSIELVKGSLRSPSEGITQGAIAAAAMLVTGLSVEGIQELRVVKESSDVPSIPTGHYLVVSEALIVMPGPKLIDGFVPPDNDSQHYRPVTERLELKLPQQLHWVQLLLRFASGKIGTQPFNDPMYVENVRLFSRAVNERFGARLTPTRIAQFQSRQLIATSGDRADAALITGGMADARLYYYAPTVSHLLQCHESIWTGVYRGMGLPVENNVTEPAWAPPGYLIEPKGPYLGSRCCPTDRGVVLMVEALINHCRSTLRGRRDQARTRRVHNALVAYTCQMVMWHTGIRAVTDGVEIALYDRVTGMLGVSDKNTDSYYSSRVVWIPAIARSQIDAYLEHLAQFHQVFPELAGQGKKLYFVDEAGDAVPVRVETLKRLGPQTHVYRMNAQRHYLRTRLRELGVPAPSIDALLGHGAHGEEPYARHSCYSALRLRQDIEAPLQQLSEHAEWRVLHGLKD